MSVSVNVQVHLNRIAESGLHDLEIQIQSFQIGSEWNLGLPRGTQRHTQQIAQAGNHGIGLGNVLVHLRGNHVQRVEEKMRIQLLSQVLKLNFRELPVPFAVAVVILKTNGDQHDHPVTQNVLVEFIEDRSRKIATGIVIRETGHPVNGFTDGNHAGGVK